MLITSLNNICNTANQFFYINGFNQIHSVDSTFFGYTLSEVIIHYNSSVFNLPKNAYFSIPSQFVISGDAFIVKTENYIGMTTFGLMESQGRLKYINGCTDSILIHPVKKGDACLNALYFPEFTSQSPHIHPSIRIGIVSEGKGFAVTKDGEYLLQKGDAFLIEQKEVHCFKTVDSAMTVIAYHPDSDFGAQDHDHPMINRTFLS